MSCLTFLGLAAKAGHLEIGDEACDAAARARKARVILTASNVSENSLKKALRYSENVSIPHFPLPFSKEEIGAIVGRGTPGILAVTDIGMALAFAQKLAGEYPGRYDLQVSALETKARRAAERKAEAHRHDMNKRLGKKKKKK